MLLMTIAFTVALVVGHAPTYAVVSSLTSDLFPASIRYSGVALCSAFAGVAWAGPTPIVATALVPPDGSAHWWPLPVLLIATVVISITSALVVRPKAPAEEGAGR